MNETEAFEETGNGTDFQRPWQIGDTLSTYQIIILLWSLVCIIPNAVLICMLSKKTLRSAQFYFTLLNWTIANIVLILSTFHWAIVPWKYAPLKVYLASYSFSMSLITLTIVLVTIFTFEKFINGKRFGKYVTYQFWCAAIILLSISFVSAHVEYVHIGVQVFSAGIITVICFVILLAKIFLSCRRSHAPLNDDTYSLRLTMAMIYVLINFLERCFFIAGYHWLDLFEILKIILFADGFLNLGLLVYFDQNGKNSFLQLFHSS